MTTINISSDRRHHNYGPLINTHDVTTRCVTSESQDMNMEINKTGPWTNHT